MTDHPEDLAARCQERDAVARFTRYLVVNPYIFKFFVTCRQAHDIARPARPQEKRSISEGPGVQIKLHWPRPGRQFIKQAGRKDPGTEMRFTRYGYGHRLMRFRAGRPFCLFSQAEAAVRYMRLPAAGKGK